MGFAYRKMSQKPSYLTPKHVSSMVKRMGRKTSEGEIAEFKSAFAYWKREFGLVEYATLFSQSKMDEIAQLDADPANCTGVVSLTTSPPDGFDEEEAYSSGLHEAIHLLLARYRAAALDRHATEADISEAEERVVRVLEPILLKLRPS